MFLLDFGTVLKSIHTDNYKEAVNYANQLYDTYGDCNVIKYERQYYYDTKHPIIAGNPKPHLMGYKVVRHWVFSKEDPSIIEEEEWDRVMYSTPKPLKNWYHKINNTISVKEI